jgi:uncharacterized RDD family membrane protein YckC
LSASNPARHSFSFLLKLLGFVGIALAAFFFVAIKMASSNMQSDMIAAGYVFGVVCMALGVWLLRKGRQLAYRSADEVLTTGAPYVLYLRSFATDSDANRSAADHPRLLPIILPKTIATVQEQMAVAFSVIGPMIVVGKPGEFLPQLGGHSKYFAEEDWQAGVAKLARKAALIVMRAGTSSGLTWELENVIRNSNPTRLVLLLPDQKSDYDAFRALAEPYLPKGLPEFVPRKDSMSHFGGLVWFEENGAPHLESYKAPINPSRDSVAAALGTMLQPVFERIGVSATRKPTPSTRIQATALDFCIWIPLGLIVAFMSKDSLLMRAMSAIGASLALGLPITYVCEIASTRGGVGKRLLTMTIVDKAGFHASFIQRLYRTTFKFMFLMVWPVALIELILLLMGKSTFHDAIAGTKVVEATPLSAPLLKVNPLQTTEGSFSTDQPAA